MKKWIRFVLWIAFLISISACTEDEPPFNKLSFIPDTLVFRDGYTLGYSSIYRQTLWVVYPLTADNLRTQAVKRLNRFYSDPDLSTAPRPEDYIRSGYDRGHLVPAVDMAYSDKTMRESFYMGNISPQIPSFNRKT